MKKRSIQIGIIIIVGLALIESCGDMKPIRSWNDSIYESHRLKSVLVVGVADSMEERNLLEDIFVRKLKKEGVQGIALFSVQSRDETALAAIRAMAAKEGNDDILVIKYTRFKSGEVTVDRVSLPEMLDPGIDYNDLSLLYRTTLYKTEKRHGIVESTIYETNTGQRIWRFEIEEVNQNLTEALMDSISDTIMKKLRQGGLIGSISS